MLTCPKDPFWEKPRTRSNAYLLRKTDTLTICFIHTHTHTESEYKNEI